MKSTPKIFLSYSPGDSERVESLYQRFSDAGFKPWMDKKDILSEEGWQSSIQEAIKSSDIFLVCLSRDAVKQGFLFWEIETALDILQKMPESDTYLISVRLEECEIPEELHDAPWVDLFEENGWARLLEAINRMLTFSLPAPEPPADLVQACEKGECVLYVGAGLSASAGYPTWRQFVSNLLDWADKNKFVETDFGKYLRTLITPSDSYWVADSIVSALQNRVQREMLYEYLREIFLKPSPQLPRLYYVLREIPFSAVLTTNFDNLIEQTYENVGTRVYTPKDIELLTKALKTREFFILKLRGTLERSETLLVAPKEYRDVVSNAPFSPFMNDLLLSKTILFVGLSFEGISEAIEFLSTERQHYALVAVAGNRWQAKVDSLRRRYNIQVLPYKLSDNHPEVFEFLEKLTRKKAKEILPGYKRVYLENIGPFDNLELELNQHWNILLGDNGVGKSTIIKAIAVGICGRDAQPYSDRLIKVGKTYGRITLETIDGNKYDTLLLKGREGEVEVKSIPDERPLETERWLTIGFPPLRAMSWEQSRGPQLVEVKRRPTSSDLIFLIKDTSDPRLDELKQWIINLDYRIKDERVRNSRDKRYEKLLQEFFRIIGRLTEDVTVKFKEVELNTNQIKVITDDGEIPIEAVSQGTASLIGWIGILLKRLYEIYGQEEEPRKQYALVLMDEIDAHMHPKWQQSLIPSLTELFPNVQFIATTHSPLIVGGMPTEQVFRFARDENGKVIQLEIESDMTMGRTDQILTASLFGLETTLDKITQKEIEEYQKLLSKSSRTPEEAEEFQRLHRTLEFRIPVPQETPIERRAQELLQALLLEQVGDNYPEVQQKVLEKAKQLFAELQAKEMKR